MMWSEMAPAFRVGRRKVKEIVPEKQNVALMIPATLTYLTSIYRQNFQWQAPKGLGLPLEILRLP